MSFPVKQSSIVIPKSLIFSPFSKVGFVDRKNSCALCLLRHSQFVLNQVSTVCFLSLINSLSLSGSLSETILVESCANKITSCKSLIRNKSGPRIVPCGTPYVTLRYNDSLLARVPSCCLFFCSFQLSSAIFSFFACDFVIFHILTAH